MKRFTTCVGTAVLACSLAAGGQIVGNIDSYIMPSTQDAGVTFTAVAPSFSTLLNFGTALGSNVTYTTFIASATNYTSSLDAAAAVDITVGANSSVSGFTLDAYSGVVRITNSNAVGAAYQLPYIIQYALTASGAGLQTLGLNATYERFNTGTQQWDVFSSLGLGILSGQSKSACTPACTGSSNYLIDALSSADIRVHVTLGGTLSQGASPIGPVGNVPEPGATMLMGSGLVVLSLAMRKFRRG